MGIRNSKLMKKIFDKINPYELGIPVQHYYSPFPSSENIIAGRLKSNQKYYYDGIELNSKNHLVIFDKLKNYYKNYDFPEQQNQKYRYFSKNDMFGISSSLLLFCMINHLKPKNIIESTLRRPLVDPVGLMGVCAK